MNTNDAIKQGIANMGGPKSAAELLGVNPNTVVNWHLRGRVPAEHAPFFAIHGRVSLADICANVPWHAVKEDAA